MRSLSHRRLTQLARDWAAIVLLGPAVAITLFSVVQRVYARSRRAVAATTNPMPPTQAAS